jgi:hypothetical protein
MKSIIAPIDYQFWLPAIAIWVGIADLAFTVTVMLSQ